MGVLVTDITIIIHAFIYSTQTLPKLNMYVPLRQDLTVNICRENLHALNFFIFSQTKTNLTSGCCGSFLPQRLKKKGKTRGTISKSTVTSAGSVCSC